MTRTTKILLAATAVVGVTGAVAWAGNGMRHHAMGAMGAERFEQADADKNGDVSAEEFAAAFNSRIGGTDANNDGVYSEDEIVAEIERQRAKRMAQRIIERFDADGDGKLTKAEIESQQKKLFALLDRNDDGKIVRDELPKKGMHGGWGGGRNGGGMDGLR